MALQAHDVSGFARGNAYTDAEGKFSIPGLSVGTYRIEVAQFGGSNQSFVFDPPQTHAAGATGLRLIASKGVAISGVLVDEAGNGVQGGYVLAASKGTAKQAEAQGREDGSFELVGLESGRVYQLDAQAQGRVNQRLDDVAAGAKDVRIVLAKGLEASGKLSDAAGKAIPRASLSFRRTSGGNSQGAQTDAAGRFTVSGLVEGEYEARVNIQAADGKRAEWKTVGTIKGGDREADLRMP